MEFIVYRIIGCGLYLKSRDNNTIWLAYSKRPGLWSQKILNLQFSWFIFVFEQFFHLECIPLCISRILFSKVENDNYFCYDFLLGLLIYLFLLRLFVGFVDWFIFVTTFCWVCWLIYFCYDFLLGLLIYLFLLRLFVGFVDWFIFVTTFCWVCWLIYFCYDFLLGLLIYYFCYDFFVGFVGSNFNFVANLLNVFQSLQVDYVMFWWFKPIAFHFILHIQRFLVITKRDFYVLLVNINLIEQLD